MPKLRITSPQDVQALEYAAHTLKSGGARELIKQAGATNTLVKFDSLMKSLDGAIRHSRRCEETGRIATEVEV